MWSALTLAVICFNSRTRKGCDRDYGDKEAAVVMFQFTHPHGVRLANRVRNRLLLRVSIHAPAWGATAIIVTI